MVSLYLYNLLQIFKKPTLIFLYFTKLGMSYCYKKTYFSLLMVKMVKESPNNILMCSLGAVTYNILAKNYFYKIGFLSKVIKKEVKNYLNINEKYPALANLLPKIDHNHVGLFEYVKMSQYASVDEKESMHYAASILSQFRVYGDKAICELRQFKYMAHGLKLIGILYGVSMQARMQHKVNNLLSQPWMIGPVHGDFYLANVLKDGENKPKMIDLDEFSVKGIQAIDAFNFILDLNARQSKTTWPEVIKKLLHSPQHISVYGLENYLDYDLKEVALLYTLHRLGYENCHYHFLSNSVREEYIFVENL